MAEPKPAQPTILVQLDTDPHPSVFDAVVAIDSGVDHLLRHGNVRPEAVRDLVHGALFTRGGDDLRRTAIFVGGSDLAAADEILAAIQATFFGPFRVAVMLDPNGANTTAAAAVLAAERGLGEPRGWPATSVAVLGAGPVGRKVAALLVNLGASVRLGGPDLEAGREAADPTGAGTSSLETFAIAADRRWQQSIADANVIIAAGPAGVEVLASIGRDVFPALRVAIDLNAVAPHGLGGTKPTDSDRDRGGVRIWGALGVGGLKMKIHKAVLRALFDGEPTIYDSTQVFEVGRQILVPSS